MDDVATKIIEILRKNMKDPSKTVTLETPLSDLEIESLDLAVIVFDIEDTFGIEIPYNANEEVEAFATVGSVVDREARRRLEGEVVDADPVAVELALGRALRLAQSEPAARAGEVPDRLAALALDLAAPMPAERL